MHTSKQTLLSGWGNYPREINNIYRPETDTDIKEILCEKQFRHYLAFGLGRSYGDTALNKNESVLVQTNFNRFLSFDKQTGVLECEAGVSFEEIIKFFIPKGFFLPVTPGTKFVTLGGAIANDVHGKNHHKDGCISDHIIDFQLLLANGEIIRCSRSENADVFWATIGGIGLTGIILTTRLKLIPIETSYVMVDYQKARNLDEALEFFYQADDDYQYSVAWIDCLTGGRSLGRSVLMRGNMALRKDLKNHGKNIDDSLKVMNKRQLNVPFNAPSFVLNQWSIKLFNDVYYASYRDSVQKMVDYNSFFYPLDSLSNWNRMYGKNGFIQFQVAFPPKTSREGLKAVLEKLSQAKSSSFLAVLKSFGKQNNGLLSFPIKGHTLALDLPIKNENTIRLIHQLNELVLKYEGRVYLAKDSLLTPDLFKEMYPKSSEFLTIKQKIDPDWIFSSTMARRIGLMEG